MKILEKSGAEQQKVLLGLVIAAMHDLNYNDADTWDVVHELEYTFKTIEDVEALQIYSEFIKK